MKKHEDMIGTERMAIKSKNGNKIAIERKTVDGVEQYLLKLKEDIIINNTTISRENLMIVNSIGFHDDTISIEAVVVINVGLRSIYYVRNDGYLSELIQSYQIEPEESVYSGDIKMNITNVEEISMDLDMFKDMMESGYIDGLPEDLGKYGLYYSNLRVINNKKSKSKK